MLGQFAEFMGLEKISYGSDEGINPKPHQETTPRLRGFRISVWGSRLLSKEFSREANLRQSRRAQRFEGSKV